MNVIVTLGNPFDVYTNTRHNVAATYFDYVAKKYSANSLASAWALCGVSP